MWSSRQAPLYASRFLMGSGNERGAIAILLKSTDELNDSPLGAKSASDGLGAFVEKMHVFPSKDKISPAMMEMVLKLPCGVKSAALILEFDKGFLHIDDYPPDANLGFDILSAAISLPNFHASIFFPSNDSVRKSPMLSKFQEKSHVLSYTEVLVVPLTTPDFSMPYNVITITCTVFALYFLSLINVLRQRVGEAERFLESKSVLHSQTVFNCFGLAPDLYFFVPLFAASAKAGRLSEMVSRMSAKISGRSQESPKSPSDSSPLMNSKLILNALFVAALAVAWRYIYLE
ncbi:hypothetical protein Peur_063908 [Populus x canadensis]